ncbi:MAG: hypothetical protein ACOZAA_02945 [Pseudomonadota bacterium]
MTVVRIAFGYALAVIVATMLASFAHTQMIVEGLENSGAAVTLKQRLSMSAGDLSGLAPQYGIVIAIGLFLGFLVAAALRRVLKPLAPIAYPLAGAAAIATALVLMPILLKLDGITPIAGARTSLGFALQCLAGAAGGLAFALVAVRKSA